MRVLCLWCGEWFYGPAPAFSDRGYTGICGKVECTCRAMSGQEKVEIAHECTIPDTPHTTYYVDYSDAYPDNMGNYYEAAE